MTLASGTRLGPFVILGPLGVGGMGEVYRARDTKLERDVALKILPAHFARDRERLSRFEREARLLAALNHPHIAHIHGLEETPSSTGEEGLRALVMEVVEGPTLAERIARGPMPLDEVLPIAKQLAEALEYAHERGIIHRDLKPANVKLTAGGAVKVLDFGLAKALDPMGPGPDAEPGSEPSGSMTAPVTTRTGVILGSAAYMAPEQARGRPTDKRVDVWSFGCVLFELITGRRAFPGEDVTDTLVSVITREPDWTLLPAATPPRVRDVIARCLAKDPKQRFHDIADARLDIEQALSGSSVAPSAASAPAVVPARPATQERRLVAGLVPWAIAALATLVAAWTLVTTRREMPGPQVVTSRLSIELPDGLQLISTAPALSPDGRRLAFSALGRKGIAVYVRNFDSFDIREIAGSEGGQAPFFSPDGQWLGFHTGTLVKKAPVEGGQASALPRPPFWVSGATWASDGVIVLHGLNGGLWALNSDAGRSAEPVELTKVDASRGERSHQGPVVLPDGRVLFTVIRDGESLIGAYDPATKITQRLRASGSPVAYLQTGHLVFRQAGRLVAAAFDLEKLEVVGTAAPFLPDAATDYVAFSGAGQAAYLHFPQGTRRDLVKVDRTGAYTALVHEIADYRWPRLSPDGQRLAVGARVIGESRLGVSGLWVFDLQSGSHIRLQDEGVNTEPVWTPEGRRLIYSSSRGSAGVDLYWQTADGSGTSELLSSLPFEQWPTGVSRDGRLLAFYGQPKGKGYGIWTVTLAEPHEATQVVSSTGFVRGARFSPDGKWLAYASDETGRFEVYVRPFPGLQGKWAVSSEGGVSPAWSPDGRELLYRNGSRMMVADVTTTPAFSARPPRVLFEGPFDVDLAGDIDYDLAPDGQHFVMMLVDRAAQPRLRVLTNWTPGEGR